MKRLKQLRESAKYSQQQLAHMLQTTQQTIARWEAGKAEPNLAALRDLALIFGTSVDDLLGTNPLQSTPASTGYHLLMSSQAQDGFWGHVGLKLDGSPHSKWFPITLSTANEISNAIANVENDQKWIAFTTLANKFVLCRPAALQKVLLLDDACDEPEDDWELDLPYQGLPLELYRFFDTLHDLAYSVEVWKKAEATLPNEEHDDESMPSKDSEAAWRAFIKEISEHLQGDASEAFLSAAATSFIKAKLYDETNFYEQMECTTIRFTDGAAEQFWIDSQDLLSAIHECDGGDMPAMIRLDHMGGDFEAFYPASRISAIIMPLLPIMEAMKQEDIDNA
jgi:transcriptional regulator with XRE-family HTH domain